MKRSSASHPRPRDLLVLFAVALVVRLVYVLGIRHTPLCEVLFIDSETYDRFARMILAGNFRGEAVYSMNLLYPWFLAAIYAVADGSRFAVTLVQAVLGALSAVLVFELGRRLFDRTTAWVAGLGYALYAPAVFFSGALLTPVLIDACGLGMLVMLVAWGERPRRALLMGAGLALGLATLGRGNAILFLPLSILFFRAVNADRRARLGESRSALAALAVFTVAAMLLPVAATVRNALVEGRMVPISANYAAFYIGHNEDANGLYVMPNFVETAAFEGEVTGAREALSQEAGRELTQAEASALLFRRGWQYALTHPVRELRLLGTKAYFLINRTESPTNLNFHFARDFSWLLRALPLGMGVIAPLGLAGMVCSWRDRRRLLLLYLYAVVFVATALIFFVSAEYRFPLAAVLLLFGASFLVRLTGVLRRPRTLARDRAFILALALLPVFAIACNVRSPLLRAQSLKRVDYYNFGTLYKNREDYATAESLYRRALAIDPRFVPAHEAMADLENRRGNTREALQHLEQVRRLTESTARPGRDAATPADAALSPLDQRRVDGEKLYRAQRYEEAYGAFDRARAGYEETGDLQAAISMRNNMGLCRYKLAHFDEAEAIFLELTRTAPDYVRAWTNLGLVYEAQARFEEAVAAYERALESEPGNRKAARALEALTGESLPK